MAVGVALAACASASTTKIMTEKRNWRRKRIEELKLSLDWKETHDCLLDSESKMMVLLKLKSKLRLNNIIRIKFNLEMQMKTKKSEKLSNLEFG
jgi:hypothetical protein